MKDELFSRLNLVTLGTMLSSFALTFSKTGLIFLIGSILLCYFKNRVVVSKLELHSMLLELKKQGKRIYGIGAPSRASTLINYVGIDDGSLDCVVEIKGSHKIGKYVPGTLIPVVEESKLYEEQPEYAILLSWHIADELAPKISELGFKGDFIIPLPTPRIIKNLSTT